MAEQVIRRVWVASRKELYVYEPVTEGSAEDIGRSYDLTITPMSQPPIIDDEVVQVVADFVELDGVRAELGLHRPTVLAGAFNVVWRAVGADHGTSQTHDIKQRVYCVGHPKRSRGPF